MTFRFGILLCLALCVILTACVPSIPVSQPQPSPALPSTTPSPASEPTSVGIPVIEYSDNGLNRLIVIFSATGKTLEAFAPIQLGHNFSYTFSQDGRTLAGISDGQLYLIDLPSWTYRTFDVGLHGGLSAVVYNADETLLALTSGDPQGAIRIVDAKSGEIKASAQTDFAIRYARFTADGNALMLYGPRLARTGPAANAGVSAGAPKAALLAVSDLSLLWSVELTGIRDGTFPNKPEAANTQEIYEPGAASHYEPATAFALFRDVLYLVHGDEDKLTTIDFVQRKVNTVNVRAKTSWFDQVLALTAGVAHAKGMNGTTKQAVVSPDGKFLYVIGSRETVTQQANGNWDITDTPIGLQMISTQDGSLVRHMDTPANSVRLSPDGHYILLTGWRTSGTPWTDVYDISAGKIIKPFDEMYLIPTLRLDGKAVLASSRSISNYESEMAVVDPESWFIVHTWKGSSYIGWLIAPQPAPIRADLSFSSSLVQRLSNGGLTIQSVQASKWNGMFQSTNKAVWIETDMGILEAVFFADSTEAKEIRVASVPNKVAWRYAYEIQAPPPTLTHDVTLDLAFPMYFATRENMFLITDSADLYEALKHIFANN